MSLAIAPPAPDEYADFHKGYIAAVAHEPNGLAVLERQLSSIEKLGTLSPQQATHRYAEGKWSVKEMTGHLSDSERVLSYRLMRIARGDKTPLPGFDENAIAAASNAVPRSSAAKGRGRVGGAAAGVRDRTVVGAETSSPRSAGVMTASLQTSTAR